MTSITALVRISDDINSIYQFESFEGVTALSCLKEAKREFNSPGYSIVDYRAFRASTTLLNSRFTSKSLALNALDTEEYLS